MQKPLLIVLMSTLVLASCSRKTVPPANTTTIPYKKPVVNNKGAEPEKITTNPVKINPAEVPPVPAPEKKALFQDPMIVIDEKGEIITPGDKLPEEIAAKVDFRKIARAYTPDQRQNLIYRFKLIPPRVMFIPDHLALKTARGTYCIYKKKFWYWKKDDGLFYLDETYYQ